MMDARRDARLIQEHLDELFFARQMRMEPLDGDEALETADAGQARQEHRGHTTGRELTDELVAIDALPPRTRVEELRPRR